MNYVRLCPACSVYSHVINHKRCQTSEVSFSVLKGAMYHSRRSLNLECGVTCEYIPQTFRAVREKCFFTINVIIIIIIIIIIKKVG